MGIPNVLNSTIHDFVREAKLIAPRYRQVTGRALPEGAAMKDAFVRELAEDTIDISANKVLVTKKGTFTSAGKKSLARFLEQFGLDANATWHDFFEKVLERKKNQRVQ